MLKTYEEASRTKKDKSYILLPVCVYRICYITRAFAQTCVSFMKKVADCSMHETLHFWGNRRARDEEDRSIVAFSASWHRPSSEIFLMTTYSEHAVCQRRECELAANPSCERARNNNKRGIIGTPVTSVPASQVPPFSGIFFSRGTRVNGEVS